MIIVNFDKTVAILHLFIFCIIITYAINTFKGRTVIKLSKTAAPRRTDTVQVAARRLAA